VTSQTITLSAGVASQLSITTEPSSTAQSGFAFVQQPVIQLRDASGNDVGEAGVVVTAAIASGGGTLGGQTTATTDASGVATFTNVSITGAPGDRTLEFTATGLTPATSSTITITIDAFVAGQSGTILHYDGTDWSVMDSVMTAQYDVWGDSPRDVYVVGSEEIDQGVIAHYDGTSWTSTAPGETGARHRAVWGLSSSDVFVGGDGGCVHYDGTGWSGSACGPHTITGIWGASSSDVWAVSFDVDVWGIAHYDGVSWTTVFDQTEDARLWDVWGSASDDIYAVGSRDADPGPPIDMRPWIFHYDGLDWTTIPITVLQPALRGVWGTSASDIFAVGDDGLILRYDGLDWDTMFSGTSEILWEVWGTSANNVFAVGENGTILHYNGTGWSPMTSGTTANLYAVWAR
jgi:hypothetical protein